MPRRLHDTIISSSRDLPLPEDASTAAGGLRLGFPGHRGTFFPRETASVQQLEARLITIKEAHDIEARLNEVEKLLKTIINMPWKYSRSEVVLTFFERSPLDQVLKNDNVHKIQPSFQSPVKISEIMRSNGFCLANTETIVIDHSIPNGKEKHLDIDSAEHLFESVSDFTSELEDSDDPTAYVTNLTYYHLVPFETDILD
ncbi:PX domain-containing protein 1 isoform X2 [Cuculus canorus]|uniref:PX domain-containing protein 1 isoform X2 n=1 Tax=Cuculus canorus TaxID=55661 RepID=UPI0023AB0BF6|nr:PX domain-containing protein 1 isoform X2 [Cuculus canorus]